MGDAAGRQGTRHRAHHDAVEGTVVVTCDSRRALDVAAKQVYLQVGARPGGFNELSNQVCAG